VPLSITLLALAAPLARADTCEAYDPPTPLAEVGDSSVSEASGLAASVLRAGVFFTHGDRGGDPVLVSFDADGQLLDEHLVVNADNEDWEDVAAAPCPDEGQCLYVGDIGDNDGSRANVTVYVVREPEPGDARIRAVERYVAVYPDGPVDAETLLVHPCSGRISLITKASDGSSRVYQFPPLAEIDGTVTLQEVAQLTLAGPTAESRAATGGAFDRDGDRVVVRTTDRIFEWTVDPGEPDAHWSDAPTELVGTTERNGEGVTFADDGDLYTVGEGSPIPLSRAPCTALVPPADGAVCDFPQTGRKCGCASASPARLGTAGGLALLGFVARRRVRA
jgi:hypothetical protein